MNFPQQISSDTEKKKNSIMSNASKKTSRCNQIAKILIVYHIHMLEIYLQHLVIHDISICHDTLSQYWCWSRPFNILINKCKQLHQVPIFLGTLWNWKFYKSQKTINGTTPEISQTQKKPSNQRVLSKSWTKRHWS
jgi:hypothetical protein